MKIKSLIPAIPLLFTLALLNPRKAMADGRNTPAAEVIPQSSAPVTNTAVSAATKSSDLISHELPEIHGSISLPKEWTLLPGKLLEGDVLLAAKEKITGENDPYTSGLSMTLDRNGAKDSGQKASDYAMVLAREARDKAGEEASPLRESQNGPFHEVSFDFPVPGDQPLQITEVLRSNEKTGTLAVILWQTPKEEAVALQPLRDAILSNLKLDPEK